MIELMVVKILDGSTVLTEVSLTADMEGVLNFKNPLEVKRSTFNGEEAVTAIPFLAGTDEETITVGGHNIVAISPANGFYRKFYGSALFRTFIQKTYQKMISDGSSKIDSVTKMMLQSKRLEILSNFGMIDEREFDDIATDTQEEQGLKH